MRVIMIYDDEREVIITFVSTCDLQRQTILTRTFQILQTTNALMSVTSLILDPIVANFDAQYDDILLDANNHAM